MYLNIKTGERRRFRASDGRPGAEWVRIPARRGAALTGKVVVNGRSKVVKGRRPPARGRGKVAVADKARDQRGGKARRTGRDAVGRPRASGGARAEVERRAKNLRDAARTRLSKELNEAKGKGQAAIKAAESRARDVVGKVEAQISEWLS